MTMRWTDGFYTAENATNLAMKYDYVNSTSLSPSYSRVSLGTNSYGVSIPATGIGSYVVKSLKSLWSATTPIIVGFRYKLPTGVGNGNCFFAIRSSDTSDAQGYDVPAGLSNAIPKNGLRSVFLSINGASGTTAGFTIRRSDSFGQPLTPDPLFTSSATALSSATFAYIELMIYPGSAGSNGRIIARINGTQVYDSGATLGWNYTPSLGFNEVLPFGFYGTTTPNPVAGGVYADMYVCDTNGTTNNAFLGDTTIETVLPNADGTTQQFQLYPKNLLPDTNTSGLDTDVSAWSVSAGTISRVTSGGPGSSTQGASGYGAATGQGGGTGDIVTTPYTLLPVVGGGTYVFSIDGATSIATNNTFAATIRWFTSAGVFISASTGTAWATTANTWQRVDTGAVTAPANAAYCQVGLHYSIASTPGGPYIWWDGARLAGPFADATMNTYVAPTTSHLAAVNETSPDLDGSFVKSATSGSIEAFKYPLASASGLIAAVNFAPILKRETLGSNTLLPYSRTRGSISYIANQNAHFDSSSIYSQPVTLPFQTQAGDCVVLVRYTQSSLTASSASGLGATWVTSQIYNGAGAWLVIHVGYNCSAGQQSVTVSGSGANTYNTVVSYVFRGVRTDTNPVVGNSFVTTSGGNGTTLVLPTPTAVGQLAVVAFAIYNGSQTNTSTGSPAGLTSTPFIGFTNGNDYVSLSYGLLNSMAVETYTKNDSGNFVTPVMGFLLDPAMTDNAGASSVVTPTDTNYHQATGIVETNLAATSRALTIAEFNAAEFGLVVP